MGKLWMIGAASALGVLLVVSVAVALLERETEFEAGTPEAKVQSFLQAMDESEYEDAYSMLTSSLQQDCGPEQIFASRLNYDNRFEDNRITLERTDTVGAVTFVTLRVTEFRSDGPFGSSESSYEQQYALEPEDGDWRFRQYPWPLYDCGAIRPPTPAHETLAPKPVPAPEPTPALTPTI